MRGKAVFGALMLIGIRITPAYAGKSNHCIFGLCVEKDHPRLCGEKCVKRRKRVSRLGSPPPMRGKVNVVIVQRVLFGITPAYAGKSSLAYHASV